MRNVNSIKFIKTPLYNPNDKNDKTKLCFALKSFMQNADENLNQIHSILKTLEPKTEDSYTLFIKDLKYSLDFSRAEFNKAITLNPATSSNKTNHANPFENSKFELVKLGEAINENPKSSIQVNQAKENTSGQFPFYTSGLNIYRFDTALISGKNIFLSTGGNALVQFFDGQCAYSTDTYAIKSIDEKEILTQFIYLILQSLTPLINEFYFKGMGLKHLQKKEFKNIQIPKPPLEIQKQIVEECEKIEKQNSALNKAKQCLKELIKAILAQTGISEDETQEPTSLLNTLLEFQSTFKALSLNFKFDLNALQKDLNALPHPPQQGWEKAKLGEICKMYQPQTITAKEIKENGEYKVYGANGIIGFYDKYNHENSEVAMTCRGATCGTINLTEPKSWITGNAMVITPLDENKIIKLYLKFALSSANTSSVITGSAQPQITRTNLEILKIPLPPLKEQEKISSCIEKLETQISHLNSMLLNLETQKTNIIKGYLF